MDVFVEAEATDSLKGISSAKGFKPFSSINHKEAGLAESGSGSGLQRNFSRKKVSSKPRNVDIRVRRFESGTRLHKSIT